MPEREELNQLAANGLKFSDPYGAVEHFEKTIAEYCGSPYAVAMDCVTHAMELSLRFLGAAGAVSVPKHTYPSVPMMIMRLGCQVNWSDERWAGAYKLSPFPVFDSSLRFRQGMYLPGTFTCLSFQQKKRIGIGRGGMVLVDDIKAYHWLKKACHDGRTPGVRWHDDNIDMIGWHYYMTPDDAARGILLFDSLGPDLSDLGGWERYPDLTGFKVFKKQSGEA